MCNLVQAMLAKTISSFCRNVHFVVKGLFNRSMITIPHGHMRVKYVLLSILSKHWGFEVAEHNFDFRSAVFVCSSIN